MQHGRRVEQTVNYDAVARTYNQRFTHSGEPKTSQGLVALCAEINAKRALEVGCGTGHYLAALHTAKQDESLFYGLDLSTGMLRQAQTRRLPLNLARGQAENLPYARQSLDLIYCVNAIHHFSDPHAFILKAKRALRPGGALAIIGMDPRGHEDDWYIYRYFPGTFAFDLARFPSWGTITDWLIAAGFERLRLDPAEIIHAPKTGAEVFQDPFLRKDAASQLTLLSQEEYDAGIQRIKSAIAFAESRGAQMVFESNIYIYRLVAFLAHEETS